MKCSVANYLSSKVFSEDFYIAGFELTTVFKNYHTLVVVILILVYWWLILVSQGFIIIVIANYLGYLDYIIPSHPNLEYFVAHRDHFVRERDQLTIHLNVDLFRFMGFEGLVICYPFILIKLKMSSQTIAPEEGRLGLHQFINCMVEYIPKYHK